MDIFVALMAVVTVGLVLALGLAFRDHGSGLMFVLLMAVFLIGAVLMIMASFYSLLVPVLEAPLGPPLKPFAWGLVLWALGWVWWVAQYILSAVFVYAVWHVSKRVWIWFCNPVPAWLARWLGRPVIPRCKARPVDQETVRVFAEVEAMLTEAERLQWQRANQALALIDRRLEPLPPSFAAQVIAGSSLCQDGYSTSTKVVQ